MIRGFFLEVDLLLPFPPPRNFPPPRRCFRSWMDDTLSLLFFFFLLTNTYKSFSFNLLMRIMKMCNNNFFFRGGRIYSDSLTIDPLPSPSKFQILSFNASRATRSSERFQGRGFGDPLRGGEGEGWPRRACNLFPLASARGWNTAR